jgi:hypothetical protein
MITMAGGRSITMAAAVRVVGVVGITTTSGTSNRRVECVRTWGVPVGRRRVPQWCAMCVLTHGTQRLGLRKVAKGPWCTRKAAGSGRLRYG